MAGFKEIWCQGRLKEAVESLYLQSEACVRVQGKNSEWFEVAIYAIYTHICTHTNISIMCTNKCTRVHGTDWNTLLLHLVSGNRHFQCWRCSCYTLSGYALSLYNTHGNTRMDHFQLQRQHI